MSVRPLRLAILGASPCALCTAACCKQNGHDFAVLLRGDDEHRRFAAFAVDVSLCGSDGRTVVERVLPYREGRCQFLGEDDRCTIYEDRPRSCREFECAPMFNARSIGRHGEFLKRNPSVRNLLETL